MSDEQPRMSFRKKAFYIDCSVFPNGIIYAVGKKAARKQASDIIIEKCDMPRELAQMKIRCRPATLEDENLTPNFGSGIL